MDSRYVFIDASVLSGIYSHALSNREEIAGFLIGKKINEKLTNDILVTDFSPQEEKGTNVNVTLTPQHVAKARAELDKRKTGERIVGWYHSHPEIKVFMSSDDKKVQKSYQDKNKDFIGLVASYISDKEGSPDGIKFKFGMYCLVGNKPEEERMSELRCRVIPREHTFDLPSEASKKLDHLLDELQYIDRTNEKLKKFPSHPFIEYINTLNTYYSKMSAAYNSLVMDRSNIKKLIESQTEFSKKIADSERKYEEISTDYNKKMNELKSEIRDKTSELDNYKGLYEKINNENLKLKNDNRKLYGDKGKLEGDIKQLKNNIKKTEEEIKKLNSEKEVAEEGRKAYRQEHSKLYKELEGYKRDNQKLREELNKIKNKNKKYEPPTSKPEGTSLGSVRDSL